MELLFSLASYNSLATSYINPAWYPYTPAEALNPQWRIPALTQRIVDLSADVVCLQEVEADTFSILQAKLLPRGYAAHYAPKEGGKPDGCATFFRTDLFELLSIRILAYADRGASGANSGHIALVTLFRLAGQTIGIANTHLKWDPPGIPRKAKWGYRQITQLLNELDSIAPSCPNWIVCGDFNVTPESDVIRALKGAGLSDAYGSHQKAYTCNSNGSAKRIDYLFHTSTLRSEPGNLPSIDDKTPLPSTEEPSDHLPIIARFSMDYQSSPAEQLTQGDLQTREER